MERGRSQLKETFEGLIAAVEKKVSDAGEQKEAAQIISAIRQRKWKLGTSTAIERKENVRSEKWRAKRMKKTMMYHLHTKSMVRHTSSSTYE